MREARAFAGRVGFDADAWLRRTPESRPVSGGAVAQGCARPATASILLRHTSAAACNIVCTDC